MIFENAFFTEMLLPFLLVFVVIFAILQKSKILGEGMARVDAMVGLVIGLLLIGVPQPREIIVGIMPWLAVGVAVILVFLILYGFVAGDLSKMGEKHKWVKPVFAVIAAVFTVGVVLYVSGLSNIMIGWFEGAGESDFWMSVVMIALVIGVIALVMVGSKKSPSGRDSSRNSSE